jgi:hypothetical protein
MEKVKNNPRLKKGMGIIVIIVIILIILWLIRRYDHWKKDNPKLLPRIRSFRANPMTIPAKKIPPSAEGEFTYSFWMFIEDWGYKINQAKCVMYRGQKGAKITSPGIWLYPYTNKLMVRMATLSTDINNDYLYPKSGNMNPQSNPNMLSKEGTQYVCDVPNIPLQRWVHVAVSVFNRTCDVYINGKLARSCILNGPPNFNAGKNADLHVGDFDGFGGYLSCIRIFDKALDPRKVYNLYEQGPGCQDWGINLSSYKVQLEVGKTDDWEDAASASLTF